MKTRAELPILKMTVVLKRFIPFTPRQGVSVGAINFILATSPCTCETLSHSSARTRAGPPEQNR